MPQVATTKPPSLRMVLRGSMWEGSLSSENHSQGERFIQSKEIMKKRKRKLNAMKTLDIVVPCYNESECVKVLYQSIEDALKGIEIRWSVLYVNDGSRDDTLSEIKKLVATVGSDRVKYISFSRNFGKESAIYAGLSYTEADYVVLMDADLQHPPALLKKMLAALEEGYDCVGARRVSREGEPKIRSAFSRFFYAVINHVTDMNLVQGGSDFRMMKRSVVRAIISLQERERFTKGIMSWVGFNTKWIEYENVERVAGTTKWSFWGLARYAMNGFFAFAVAPLRLAVWLGLSIDFVAAISAIVFAIRALASDGPRTGFGTIVLLVVFFGGTIIFLLGIIGEYLARIYAETKKRPIFIIKDTNINQFHTD